MKVRSGVPVDAALALTLLVVGAGVTVPSPALAQGQNIILRPTYETNVILVGNPQHARDDNPYSAAGGSWGRLCSKDCTNPITAAATWQGVPDGYRPVRLEVDWTASAGISMYGNDHAVVTAKLEYDAGDGWTTLEEYMWRQNSPPCSDGGISCSNHRAESPLLSPTTSTAAIKVRVQMGVHIEHCDNCWIRISSAQGTMSVFDIRIVADTCYMPYGETTAFAGWDAFDGAKALFEQTLIPPSGVSFGGRKVVEQDPGGGGPDTCDIPGDAIDPWTSVTGGLAFVNPDNTWRYDHVGWSDGEITSYRANGAAPCGTTLPARMIINCGENWSEYQTHLLRVLIGETTITSERASVPATRTYP